MTEHQANYQLCICTIILLGDELKHIRMGDLEGILDQSWAIYMGWADAPDLLYDRRR